MVVESLTLRAEIEDWPLAVHFKIAGYTFEFIDVLVVSLEKDGRVGRGQAACVYYKDDKPIRMMKQIEQLWSE